MPQERVYLVPRPSAALPKAPMAYNAPPPPPHQQFPNPDPPLQLLNLKFTSVFSAEYERNNTGGKSHPTTSSSRIHVGPAATRARRRARRALSRVASDAIGGRPRARRAAPARRSQPLSFSHLLPPSQLHPPPLASPPTQARRTSSASRTATRCRTAPRAGAARPFTWS